MNDEITRHGFGYDFIRDDYVVIKHVMYNRNNDNDSDKTLMI